MKEHSYLDSIIHFAYVLLRMLEKYSKTKAFMFIRKRKNTHKKRKERQAASQANADREQRKIPEEYGDEGEEAFAPDEDAPSYAEHAFTFQSFEKVRSFFEGDRWEVRLMDLRWVEICPRSGGQYSPYLPRTVLGI